MLLTASADDRMRMMADRQIQPRDIAEARQLLRLRQEDEEELANVLDSLLPEAGDHIEGQSSDAALEHGKPGGTLAQHLDPGGIPRSGDNDQTPPHLEESSKPAPKTPPPIDFPSVQIVDGIPSTLSKTEISKPKANHGGGLGTSKAPGIQTEEEMRRVGKRGEEVAYDAERRRLKKLGKNPDSVHWVSKANELSPYDMTSVDEDDQLIYIEVKSTRGDDPTEAFYISQAELIEATFRRGRFYIYRVTNVDTALPSITRWADPLGLIKDGKGRLLLAKAQMALTLDKESNDAPSA